MMRVGDDTGCCRFLESRPGSDTGLLVGVAVVLTRNRLWPAETSLRVARFEHSAVRRFPDRGVSGRFTSTSRAFFDR